MKKVLLASTALVAFAGAASADISMKGWAEMGIIGGDYTYDTNGTSVAGGTVDQDTQFWTDIDIEFTLSGESDSGLSFGARVDLDETNNLGSARDNQGTSAFIKGSFGTLTLGDTDGAVDWAMTDAGNIGNPGSIADDETTHAGYFGTFGDGVYDNQVLRYDYSFGDFGFAVSHEQGAIGSGEVLDGATDGSTAIGVKYAMDFGGTTLNLGAGYMATEFAAGDGDLLAVSVSSSFAGGFSAGVTYTTVSDDEGAAGNDWTHVGVGVGFEVGEVSLHANYGEFDFDLSDDVSGFGLAAAYDLGGGLSVNAGYGSSDFGPAAEDFDTYSVGFVMSF